MLQRLLFRIAKGPMIGRFVGYTFQYATWAIPVKKVYLSKDVIAFHHPQPAYESHVILSPRRAVRDLCQLASDGLSPLFMRIWEATKTLHVTDAAYRDAFVLVANGGKRQEVQQVHFHMFTNHAMVNEYAGQGQAESTLYRDQDICVLAHPNPNWALHFVLVPIAAGKADQDRYFQSVLRSIDRLNEEYHIVPKGYSLIYQYKKQKNDMELPIFHIVSGTRLSPAE